MAIQEQEINTDRRRFLQIAAGGLTAGLAGVALVGKANEMLDAIGNSNINSFPLYENHITSIETYSIPQDTDIFLKEGVSIDGNYYDMPAEKVVENLNDDLVKKLSAQGTEFMIADVGDLKNLLLAYFATSAGEGALGIGALVMALKNGSEKAKKGFTRRKVLKYLGLGIASWTLAPLATGVLTAGITLQKNEAVTRVVERFNSLAWDLHPEQVIVFFRNLVFADKLLEVGQDFKETQGREPKIAFNIGGGHGGVEDFLRAGQDVCRELIMAYPDFVLKYFVESAGGIENFCTARLLKITTPKMAVAAPTTYGQTKDAYISDRRVLDNVLVGKLKSL